MQEFKELHIQLETSSTFVIQKKKTKTTIDHKNQINTCVPPVVGDHPGVARAAESHLLLHDLSECSADMQRLESASHDPIHEHRAQV